MKLQAQYNRISIISSIIVLLIAGIGYYFLIHYVLKEQLDNTLRVEQVEIQDFIQTEHTLPAATTYKDQKIEFKKADQVFPQSFRTFRLYDEEEKENELCRQLLFPVQVDGQWYTASVTKSQEETEEMIGLILLITLGLILILSSLLFFASRFFVKRLWQPFRATLSAIKSFNLDAPVPIKTEKAAIHEFNELNESVNLMTEKVVKDYLSLKHFTDHASHEIQTPLAIVISKLDVLIQDPALSEKNLTHLQSIYNAVDKMSKLIQSLLLLAKIENNLFSESSVVDIRAAVRNKFLEFDEWMQEKKLALNNEMKDLHVTMNPQLADTLISNLVINAIKHADGQGEICIHSDNKSFMISNPGRNALDSHRIFDRFWKSEHSDGTGLGLAIVKRICDQYGYSIQYEFKEGVHFFTLVF
ncbi:MAG TPA: HAMP domain-containing sensor histidine kinase [Chitinophagaceae bacterium]|nr:HAMP domain-containing sensor histidine kinase [Chitinophagaceae bacterium]